ncbi:trans-aconitate 2-methyltransferase [Chroococcus sp. FPU101]|uniref:class I SAM-dependent methyltransferase n=1 Tax=Chroococcus sp. FPU101 TaxID=1974212 RepID=UPI001A8C40C4|nr:class I SAM-dependent methyltransferase [Chroococcus sp. FPU101]GFE71850.1 Methyltransferase type 11 [Chroococcus sp. FPU101]
MTEWNAIGYQSVSSLQEALATKQLSRLTLAKSARILDIGCGNGKVTAAIAQHLPQGSVLGVDASQNMITFAQQNYGSPIHPNLHFEVGDARKLTYQHEFDQIVSFNALHWIPEQDAVLCSIHTALKTDGQALLRFVPEGSRKSIEDVVEEVCQLPRWSNYFQNHQKPYFHPTPEAYRILAEQNGLKVLQIQVEDQSWDFQTRQAFFAYCQVTLAEWTRFLPLDEWTAFITNILDRYQIYAADTPSENNTFKFYQMEVVLTPL